MFKVLDFNKLKFLTVKAIKICWPLTIIMFFEFLMGLADVYVAGKISKEISASYGFSFQLYLVGLIPAISFSTSVVYLVSRLFTASNNLDKQAFYKACFTSSVFSFLAGLLALFLGIVSYPLVINFLNIPEGIKNFSTKLITIYSFALFFEYFFITANAILRSCAKVVISVKNYAIVTLLNIILNFLLTFFTPLGYRGIAVATAISLFVGALFSIFSIKEYLVEKKFEFSYLRKMFKVAYPVAIMQILWNIAVVLIYTILGNLATNTVEILAAFTNGLKIEAIMFLLALAFNMSSAVLVGNFIGEKKFNDAFYVGRLLALLGFLVVAIIALFIILNAPTIMNFLSDNLAVTREGLIYLYITLIFEPILAWSVILNGSLSGAGYTKDILFSMLIGVWIIRVPFSYLVGVILKKGAIGIWFVMNFSILIQAIFVAYRYYRRMHPEVLAKNYNL